MVGTTLFFQLDHRFYLYVLKWWHVLFDKISAMWSLFRFVGLKAVVCGYHHRKRYQLFESQESLEIRKVNEKLP